MQALHRLKSGGPRMRGMSSSIPVKKRVGEMRSGGWRRRVRSAPGHRHGAFARVGNGTGHAGDGKNFRGSSRWFHARSLVH